MQSLALAFAIALLSFGGLLNTLVLAYFVGRACRVFRRRRAARHAVLHRDLLPAHR